MRYTEWNQILIEYYFNESKEGDTFLGIEKEAFIDYIIDNKLFSGEYSDTSSNFPLNKKDIRTDIWDDFTLIFKKPLNQENQAYYSKDVLIERFRSYLYNSKDETKQPLIFPFIALFLMPLANNPEMNAKNFYKRLNDFLRKNKIIREEETIGTTDLKNITDPSLETMWKNLESWAKSKGYNYKVKGLGGLKYVGPFMAESVLNANQRDKFKVVFYEAGLTQDLILDDERIVNILKIHHRHLGFTDDDKWEKIFTNYRDNLISEFKRQYAKWDGNTIVRTHTNDRRVNVDTGTNKKLYLGMDCLRGNYSFYLKARFDEVEPGTDYLYHDGRLSYKFRIGNDGFANEKFTNDNDLERIVCSNSKITLCDSKNRKNRLSFQSEEIYLLEKYYMTYTSSCQIKIGGKFYVLVSKQARPEVRQWLEANNAQLKGLRNAISQSYDLYLIEEVVSDLPDIKVLNSGVGTPSAKLVNTYHYLREDSIDYIYKGLPAYFDIQGVNISHDNVRAVIDDATGRKDARLTYNEDMRLWVMQPTTNTFSLAGTFKIYCNDKAISSKTYGFTDFIQLENDSYREICYDKWGEYTETNAIVEGLRLNGTPGLLEYLKVNMRQFGSIPIIHDTPYDFKDYLLYFLSSKPRISKEDFTEAVKVQVHNNIADGKALNKWSIKSLIDNYFRLGYINYAYQLKTIAINKPTLVLIPSKANRTADGTLRGNNCKEKHFKAMLTGARTPGFIEKFINRVKGFTHDGKRIQLQLDKQINPLYPQRIILWSEDVVILKKFAEKYGILFQVSIYANSLLSKLGSVADYEQYICETYDKFPETYEGFNDYSALDFSYLAECKEDGRRVDYKRVYRDTFDREGDVVTYFPGKYTEKTILWKDGKQYPVDKYWGQFIGMKIHDAKVIEIDSANSTIKLPKYIRLPFLYARALTLMTGETPETSNDRRAYELCDNPFAQAIAARAIIEKLSQN